MSTSSFTAVLLAGGQSSRFGSDKALVLKDGQPLWQHQWAKLHALQPEKMFLSLREAKSWVPADLEVVYDQSIQAGPLAALSVLLAKIETTHLLVLAVDLPAMTSDYLQTLQQLAPIGCGIVPQHEDWYQGLCAIYPRESASLAAMCMESADRSVQHFIRECLAAHLLHVTMVGEDNSSLFANWNHPAKVENR